MRKFMARSVSRHIHSKLILAAALLVAVLSPRVAVGASDLSGALGVTITGEELAVSTEANVAAVALSNYQARPQRRIRRKTFDGWAAEWWRWVSAIPTDRNPLNDTTGAYCTEGQAGDVWFLAAGAVSSTPLECTIPADKYLFFPIVSVMWVVTDEWESFNLGRAAVNQWLDHMTAINTKLNNATFTRLRSQRSESGKFSVFLPFNNRMGITSKPYWCTQVANGYSCSNAVENGYWVMVSPLPPGTYNVVVQGSVDGSTFSYPGISDFELWPFAVNTAFRLTVQ